MHSFDAGNFAGKQRRDCIGMPASDPSDETGIMEMAHNPTAEKSGAAKYGHAQRHDAKVSPQLRLRHSHSTGGQSRHAIRRLAGHGGSHRANHMSQPRMPAPTGIAARHILALQLATPVSEALQWSANLGTGRTREGPMVRIRLPPAQSRQRTQFRPQSFGAV
jgi:hypothetical protein